MVEADRAREPAQRQALELGLLGVCVGLLSDQTLLASGQNVIESTCRLIDLLIASRKNGGSMVPEICS